LAREYLLGVKVGEDFLALFEGAAQRGIFHEEPERLDAAGRTSLNDAGADDTGLRVDAGDPARGLVCILLLRRVGGEAAEGQCQHEKHEAEEPEVAGRRDMRFILNVNHGYPSPLFGLDGMSSSVLGTGVKETERLLAGKGLSLERSDFTLNSASCRRLIVCR
jgi:hypothetical protein